MTVLLSIPGVQRRTAEVVVAEIGTDMTRFPTSRHLASWAGLCPGNNESAGKRKHGRTTKGSPWLRTALVEAALGATRKNGYLQAKYRRVRSRRGPQRAVIPRRLIDATKSAYSPTVWTKTPRSPEHPPDTRHT